MRAIRILDVTDLATFDRVPPCADPGFDHRSCDYWEDADRGSKAARLSWLEGATKSGKDAGSARPRPGGGRAGRWRGPKCNARPTHR